jgi:hypothetical protein
MKEIDFSQILNAEKVIRPFEEKRKSILKKLASFNAKEEEEMAAKIRLLKRDQDEALVDGDQKLASSIQEQIEEIQTKQRKRKEEIISLSNELAAIPEEIKQQATVVLNEVFPEIKRIVHSKWDDALTAGEKAWSTLQEYAQATDVRLFDFSHKNALGPAQDKIMMKRLEEWIEI